MLCHLYTQVKDTYWAKNRKNGTHEQLFLNKKLMRSSTCENKGMQRF